MIAPTEPGKGGADSINVDSLAVASRGTVTETDIAKNGANPGERVGHYVWTLGEISPTGFNNINECINRIGMNSNTNIDHHSAYALTTLEAQREQRGVAMRVGSDDAIKVWLNGQVVHTNAINRGAVSYQDEFAVNLQEGKNLLMVKVSEGGTSWSMFVGINADVTAAGQQVRSEPDEMVQLIYFLPSDRPRQQNIDAKLDGLIKEAQQFYSQQMNAHGFGAQTFQFETDHEDKVVVHHINGEFADAYYQEEPWERVWVEVEEQFNSSNIYIVVVDISGDVICGAAVDHGLTGRILIPASGFCLNVRTITHELGHTFGLAHDFRSDTYRMSYGANSDRLSVCAAEWLDAHRYFNTYPTRANRPTKIEMLRSPSKPPSPIRLRFKVSDPDGLHQFQLLSPDDTGDLKLLRCERINGNNRTIEFITSELEQKPGHHLTVRVMDAWGNHVEQAFPDYIDIINPIDKITGSWLWVITPIRFGRGGKDAIDIDSLADASDGAVSEAGIARNGANLGERVGNYVWTLGEIAPTGKNNINELINHIGLSSDTNIDNHSSYALTTLEAQREQYSVTMRVGSDDAIKVWLNGEVVHKNAINRGASDFQDTFQVNLKKGDNLLLVKVSEWIGDWSMFVGIDAEINADYKRPPDTIASVDINKDGVLNVLDLILIALNFEKTGENVADVNNDGVVNIVDLVKVAGEVGAGAAAPAAHSQTLQILTAADVQKWLSQAQHLPLTDIISQRGIRFLEQLLVALVPKETALLPNYPNPFNPETWIPYQLSEPAEVILTIYAVDGQMIRRLAFGHQLAGTYRSKSRAAYWDGRNEVGEAVASGVYFYTLTAGEFTATRKMLIRK